MTTLSNNTSPTVQTLQITLQQEQQTTCSLLTITLTNGLAAALTDWSLYFDLLRDVQPADATQLLGRVGSHLNVAPLAAATLQPDASVQLRLRGNRNMLQRISDLPRGFYVRSQGATYTAELVAHDLPHPASAAAQRVDAGTVSDGAYDGHGMIPSPNGLRQARGHFHWPDAPVYASTSIGMQAVDWLQQMLRQSEDALDDASNPTLKLEEKSSLAEEHYRLRIDTTGVVLQASSSAGFMRGAATLLQLIERHDSSGLPCLEIDDGPRYRYRGLMLDCARHFHSTSTLLDLLDWMALYKFNHFHWHLTDDEAWRLQITALPELTGIGAWRGASEVLPPQLGSGPGRYGGYYSNEDVARVVSYAAARGITVVPEIDIPGHCRAAIQSLPQLLQEPADKSCYTSVQFFTDNVLNPGLPGTYQFIDTVLEEVCKLFPGEYIHMGADEVPAGAWAESPACRALMAREGYREPKELQGHLLRHAQQFLAARKRTLMGWEEAAEGGKLEKSAPIFAWTGLQGVSDAIRNGYPVVACPAPWSYLDLAWSDASDEPGLYWAGTADLEACYLQRPCPGDNDTAQTDQIMGIQANLWSELVSTPAAMQYMLFPRLFATAEWAWSDNAGNSWHAFHGRAQHQLQCLARRGVTGRKPDPDD